MKNILISLLCVVSIKTAQAGSLDCKGTTISEDGPQPARIILSYESFPAKIKKLTIITDETRSWKINLCKEGDGLIKDCKKSKLINPEKEDFVVLAINHSGAGESRDERGFFLQRQEGILFGYFWDGSIMSPEIEISTCKKGN